MTIIQAYPPMIDEIDAVFHVVGKKVIYAWGNDIYNPCNIWIPKHLLAHEAVHQERQKEIQATTLGHAGTEARVRAWWELYLSYTAFRLTEETLAHRAEYQHLIQHGNRHQRRSALASTASRLGSPLYGSMPLTPRQARELIGGI